MQRYANKQWCDVVTTNRSADARAHVILLLWDTAVEHQPDGEVHVAVSDFTVLYDLSLPTCRDIIQKRITCQSEIVNNLCEFDSCIDNHLVHDMIHYALLQSTVYTNTSPCRVFILAARKWTDIMTSCFHWQYILFVIRFSKALASCSSSGRNAYGPATCDLQR